MIETAKHLIIFVHTLNADSDSSCVIHSAVLVPNFGGWNKS